MDPYTSGFAIADQLEDTLLGYVMANRQLNEQARQFNRAQDLRDRTFAEDTRRFDIGEDRQQRYETLEKDTRRANRAMLGNLASYRRQRKLQDDWDRSRNEFMKAKEDSPFSFIDSLNIFDQYPTREDKYAAQFEKLVGSRPEPQMSGLPQFGTTGSIVPTIGISEYLQSLDDRNPNNLLKIIGTGG